MFVSASARHDDGMTLWEVLVTLALVSLLLTITVPILLNVSGSSKTAVSSTNAQLTSSFISQWENEGYAVEPGTGMHQGYLIAFDDRNGNQALDAGEPLFGRLAN